MLPNLSSVQTTPASQHTLISHTRTDNFLPTTIRILTSQCNAFVWGGGWKSRNSASVLRPHGYTTFRKNNRHWALRWASSIHKHCFFKTRLNYCPATQCVLLHGLSKETSKNVFFTSPPFTQYVTHNITQWIRLWLNNMKYTEMINIFHKQPNAQRLLLLLILK